MPLGPNRCPECTNSLGGMFERSQFEKLERNVWECRECGHVKDFR